MPFRLRRSHVILIVLLVLVVVAGLGTSRWVLRRIFPIRYGETISRTAEMYQLDPYLVAAVIQVESHFDPYARSAKGAIGLMQLMPETAAWIAAKRETGQDELSRLYDPEVNIAFGCWYLRSLLDEFHDDVVIGLAAYNGGRGRVKEWLLSQRWSGDKETADQIPYYETRFYVRRVLATSQWYRQLYPVFPGSPAEGKRRVGAKLPFHMVVGGSS